MTSDNSLPENSPHMSDKDLQARLKGYSPASPSDLLQNRILKMAKQTPQDIATDSTGAISSVGHQAIPHAQNDRAPFKMKWAAGLVCAFSLGVIALTQFGTTQTDQSNVWQEAALELGISDIYDWVENTN